MMKKNKLGIGVVVGIVLIGVVGYLVWPKADLPAVDLEGDVVISDPTIVVEVPTDTASVIEEPTKAAATEESPTEVVVPTPRSEMAGTDPSTVNLASGKLQLVEIFAFW
jgi:hypothetical protein